MSENREDINAVHPFARRFLFLETKGFKTFVFFALLIGSIALIAADLIIHRHAYFTFEGWRGFHAFYGFLAFTFAVLCGWPLRRLLGRSENYYGGSDDDA